MTLKKSTKTGLLWLVAALLFAIVAINKTISGDSTPLMIFMPWISAIAFSIIGFRELVKRAGS